MRVQSLLQIDIGRAGLRMKYIQLGDLG